MQTMFPVGSIHFFDVLKSNPRKTVYNVRRTSLAQHQSIIQKGIKNNFKMSYKDNVYTFMNML